MADPILREIDQLIDSHTNRHVAAWKADGKPVVGYFCHYVPTEPILAAGALPLRLRGAGSTDSSLGDAYLSGRLCTYVRHTLSLILDDAYDFLDGAICSNCCDHVRRMSDVLNKKTELRFKGFLSIPRALRPSLYPYFRDELRNLYQSMTAALDTEPDDDRLRQAIATHNQVRARLAEINRLRLLDRPKLSGAESLAVHIASQVLPPPVFLELADRLLPALAERPGLASPRGRLLLVGAELDEPAYVAAIESQGALVVADRLCFGSRSVLEPIAEDADDPLDAIGRAYFFRPSCARMMGDFPGRWAELAAHVAAARADGVIFQRLVFCDPWGADLHNINSRMAAEKPPFAFLSLSREYGIVPTGQIKTRIQAFLEKLEIARARAGDPAARSQGEVRT